MTKMVKKKFWNTIGSTEIIEVNEIPAHYIDL